MGLEKPPVIYLMTILCVETWTVLCTPILTKPLTKEMNNWWTDIRSSFKQQHQQQQQQQQQKTIVKRPIMERCASLISELIDSWLIWKWPPYANELCYQAAAISLQAELFQAVSQQHPSALIGSLNCYSFIRELCRVSFFFCFVSVSVFFYFDLKCFWRLGRRPISDGRGRMTQPLRFDSNWSRFWFQFEFNCNGIGLRSSFQRSSINESITTGWNFNDSSRVNSRGRANMQMRPVLCKWPASARLTINNNSGSPPLPQVGWNCSCSPISPPFNWISTSRIEKSGNSKSKWSAIAQWHFSKWISPLNYNDNIIIIIMIWEREREREMERSIG